MKLKLFTLSILLIGFFMANSQDGTLDLSFGSGGKVVTSLGTLNDRGNALAIQNDGKIIVVGSARILNNYFTVLRYQTNGLLDSTFAIAGVLTLDLGTSSSVANTVAIQADGKIVVGGHNNSDFVMIRLHTNGTLDTSFHNDGKVTTSFGTGSNFDNLKAIKILSNGKILVVGDRLSGNYDIAIARYNIDGTLDNTFGTGGKVTTSHPNGLNEFATDVALQADGKFVVAGHIATGSTYDFQILRYNENGSLDNSFSFDGKQTTDFGTTQDFANGLQIQNDGKIVVAGSTANGIVSLFALVRYNTDGTLDTSFDSDGKLTTTFGNSNAAANTICLQNDSKIIIAGTYDNNFALARVNTNGSIDTSFGLEGKVTTDFGRNENGFKIQLQNDGKIILVGNTFNDFATGFALARYNNGNVVTNDKISDIDNLHNSIDCIQVYQNSENENINIQIQNTQLLETIQLLNVQGKKIADFKTSTSSIDIQNLPKGLYFLLFTTKEKTITHKFYKY